MWRGILLGLTVLSCGDPSGPAPSPRLRDKIVFISDRDGSWQVYVMNLDGTGVRLLPAAVSGPVFFPAVSPDGRLIAYRQNGDIWVMKADGTGHINLTNHPAFDSYPAWSPDGSRIAFNSNRDGPNDVWVMNADGTGAVNLTGSPADDGSPAWSPDGASIVFDSDRDGNPEVYVMAADGANPVRLTDDPFGDTAPAWSGDGMRILFTSSRDPSGSRLYVMDPDGGNVAVIPGAQINASLGRWSPGDSLILFVGGATNPDIQVIRPDGTGLTNLTQWPGLDLMPAWSP